MEAHVEKPARGPALRMTGEPIHEVLIENYLKDPLHLELYGPAEEGGLIWGSDCVLN